MIDDEPVLIGDILISSGSPLNKIDKTPTGYWLKDLKGITVVEVAQKVTVIGETCAIAWAGSYIEASAVIRELNELNEQTPLNFDILSSYFENEYHGVGVKNPLSFIGFVKDGDTYKLFEHDAEIIDSRNFGKVVVAGSGRDDIEQLLTNAKFSGISNAAPGFDEFEPNQRAIAKVLSLIGPLFTHEMSTGQSVTSYYGGGYEIAAIVGGKPSKLEDLAYALSLVIYDKNIKAFKIYLSHIMKYEYEGDVLCIYSLECIHDLKKYNTYMLKPMSRYISQDEKSWYGGALPKVITPEFRYSQKKLSCLVFYVEYPDGKCITHTAITFEPWSHFSFQVKDVEGGNTEITLHEKVTEALTKLVGEQVRGELAYT